MSLVSCPVWRLLVAILGVREKLLQCDELAALLMVLQEEHSHLRESEVDVPRGALCLSSHRVHDCLMTTCNKTFMLYSQALLHGETARTGLLNDYNRVPEQQPDAASSAPSPLQKLAKQGFINPMKPLRACVYPLWEVMSLSVSTVLYNSYLAF
ncbi:hypothetical protein DQ04_00471190 [Trypanosoma grayi]|uniref:hypothetical protein n=1 Tax=Trypanosoma grayi TaxID=71804 RepID=UPI0004F4A4F5|nr:hypothetical protein DQ04_00471190 [Trypanosoma grayi]KEG14445.1 hypothetical protein DQ04_00471190 [Trypanosoma grayi]